MELGSRQLHSPRMRGFRQTKSRPRKLPGKPPGVVQEGRLPNQRCVCVGVGDVNGVCFFLRVSSKQTTTPSSGAEASRGHGRGGRCVGRSPCRLFAAPAETCEFGNGRQARICVEETCLAALQFLLCFCLSLARGKLLPFKCVDRRRQRVFPVP